MASDSPPTDGVYFIQNFGTGTVVELQDGSNANSTPIYGYQQRDFSDEMIPAQLWILSQAGTSSGDTMYKIENTNSRTIMDLTGSHPANGTPIIGFESNGGMNQRWVFLRNSNDTAFVIKNVATGTFVDLDGGSPDNGTIVQGWTGSGPSTTNANQLWILIKAA